MDEQKTRQFAESLKWTRMHADNADISPEKDPRRSASNSFNHPRLTRYLVHTCRLMISGTDGEQKHRPWPPARINTLSCVGAHPGRTGAGRTGIQISRVRV